MNKKYIAIWLNLRKIVTKINTPNWNFRYQNLYPVFYLKTVDSTLKWYYEYYTVLIHYCKSHLLGWRKQHILHNQDYWYSLYLMKLQIMQHRRQIVDNLEKELWIWRAKCRADGKNISKRLVQARAKWAFHNQGIVDFKVSLCTSQNLILLGNQLLFV